MLLQNIFSVDELQGLCALIDTLSKKLMACERTLGTAESCTGGLVAGFCTEIPGSSAWFSGGVVAYSNEVKQRLLGVSPALLAEHGAVSGPVVEAMAVGALKALDVDVSLAVSGIAGPDGGSDEKPVGTVWIGVASRSEGEYAAFSTLHFFEGGRSRVRFASAKAALEAVESLLH